MSYRGDPQFNNPVYGDTPTGPTTITVTPDYATGTYTISNAVRSWSATAVQVEIPPDPSVPVMKFMSPLGISPSHRLAIFNNLIPQQGTNAPTLQFHYLSFAEWRFVDANGPSYQFTAALFGTPTDVAEMPKTGTGSYTLVVSGALALSNGYSLGGNGTLSANFAAGTLNTHLELNALTVQGDYAMAVGRFDGNATFGSSSLFQGTLTSSNTSLSGTFTGAFYGPEAVEVGYAFAVKGPVGLIRPGAEQRLVGVAVGKKN